jgi:hypothetical protein
MPALLAAGNESAMNFEALGVSFSTCLLFSVRFCELGANFAQNVASSPIATEQAASGQSYSSEHKV